MVLLSLNITLCPLLEGNLAGRFLPVGVLLIFLPLVVRISALFGLLLRRVFVSLAKVVNVSDLLRKRHLHPYVIDLRAAYSRSCVGFRMTLLRLGILVLGGGWSGEFKGLLVQGQAR